MGPQVVALREGETPAPDGDVAEQRPGDEVVPLARERLSKHDFGTAPAKQSVQRTVTIQAWQRLSRAAREAVVAEAESLPLPDTGGRIVVHWS